jgi:hypothetical protein
MALRAASTEIGEVTPIHHRTEFTMRKWVFGFLWSIASAIVGFGIGYAAMSFKVVAMSPIGLNFARSNDPFARVFAEMARLGEAETALRSCANGFSLSSRQAMLRAESELIGDLRTDAKFVGLEPPIDLAEAILELRSSSALPKSPMGGDGRQAATVSELLARSGWSADSEPTLREALAKMDGPCK